MNKQKSITKLLLIFLVISIILLPIGYGCRFKTDHALLKFREKIAGFSHPEGTERVFYQDYITVEGNGNFCSLAFFEVRSFNKATFEQIKEHYTNNPYVFNQHYKKPFGVYTVDRFKGFKFLEKDQSRLSTLDIVPEKTYILRFSVDQPNEVFPLIDARCI